MCRLDQPWPVFKPVVFALRLDQTVAPEFLQGAVHVHRRKPERIGDLRLAKRQFETHFLRVASGFHADEQFAKEMRDAGHCAAAPDIGEPYARMPTKMFVPSILTYSRILQGNLTRNEL